MTVAVVPHVTSGNRILQALPSVDRQRLEPHLERVSLALRHPVIEPHQPITHVYFVHSGMVSTVADVDSDTAVEVAVTGREGLVGTSVLLGVDTSSLRSFSQIPGESLRLPTAVFREALSFSPTLRSLVEIYTQSLFEQTARTAACNRIHSIEKRCARWLLMTHDRVDGDRFQLTQEFLAQMLGVRRASVTEAAGALQDAGAIRYSRGVIHIVDRARLERAVCGCYANIRREQERLMNSAA
jgi:CRP-like cAMP-binding protein